MKCVHSSRLAPAVALRCEHIALLPSTRMSPPQNPGAKFEFGAMGSEECWTARPGSPLCWGKKTLQSHDLSCFLSPASVLLALIFCTRVFTLLALCMMVIVHPPPQYCVNPFVLGEDADNLLRSSSMKAYSSL